MGKFSTMEKRRRRERPGAVDELKQMRPQEKLLTLRIKKPSEGTFIDGWKSQIPSLKLGAQEYMKLICTASSKTSGALQAINKCTLMHFIN